jgi:hypothetical protein
MALLVEGRKFLFHADTSSENQRWYLFLVSKNAELSLKKKMKLQSMCRVESELLERALVLTDGVGCCALIAIDRTPDAGLMSFLSNPLCASLVVNSDISLEGVSACSQVIKIHETLSEVVIRFANLGDLGCCTLCTALKYSISVTRVDLQGNNIRANGAQGMSQVCCW